MRKNGVNKRLTPIDGGVCAPSGFRAGGVRCGFLPNGEREDLALILADKRVPTACVFSTGAICGATVEVAKKNLSTGFTRAAIINSGVANVAREGISLAKSVCLEVAKRTPAIETEIVIASTGKIGKPIALETFLNGIDELVDNLSATNEGSLSAARAIMTEDKTPKQLAFSFELGAFPCKIGAIFKGGARVSPTMATTLCFITTDVNISTKMLQKALNSVVKETFNTLDIDGISSPNDTVCIMASGNAGNYKIDCEDTEYDKFFGALHETSRRICVAIAKDANGMKKLLVCKAQGARSKRTARAVARAMATSEKIRRGLKDETLIVDDLLNTAYGTGEEICLENIVIQISSRGGKLILFEESQAMEFYPEILYRVLKEEEIEICVTLGKGNFSAQALGIVRE